MGKNRINCNKLRRKTKEDAIQEIFDMKMKILQVFMKHKTDIHTAVDPEGLEDISRVFDLRWWNLFRLEKEGCDLNEITSHVFENLKSYLQNGAPFIPGENIQILQNDMKIVITELIKSEALFEQTIKKDTVKSQWDLVLQHPHLDELRRLPSVILRVSLSANSEAGCEQSNSKYNRAKNKYSTTMKLPMIRARMRVGSNGPPIHLFNPTPVLEYWIDNRHRLAEKQWIKSLDESVVVSRLRKEAEKKYT